MKNKKYIIIIITLVIVILVGSVFILNKDSKKKNLENKSTLPSSTTVAIPNSDVITDYSDFDFDFHFIKLENNNRNMVYSPLSIKYALNMAREGADGKTLEELDKLLGNSKLNKYENVKDHISLANAMFVSKRDKDIIKKTFVNNIRKKYNAEVKYDEFKNANNINKWIEDKTINLIKNMLADIDVQNARTILVNALALKLDFKEPFESAIKGKFYNENKTSNVKMMHLITDKKNNKYYIDDNITVLRRDLKKQDNYEFELIVIEPENDLPKYINNFSTKELKEIINKTKSVDNSEELNIRLPKFAYEYDLNLKADLISLGVKDMFRINANFSKLSNEDLYVDDILHKALIDVDENGIKAAGATALVYDELSYTKDQKESIDLVFDHPFMYLIRNKNNGDIWFVGTVYEPELYEEKSIN